MKPWGLILIFQFILHVCHSQEVKGFRTKRQVATNQAILRDIGEYMLTNKSQILINDSIQDRQLKKKLKSINADIVTIGFNGFPHDKVTPIDSIVVVSRYHGTYRHYGKDTSWTETIIYDMTRLNNFFSNNRDSGWTKISDRIYYGSDRKLAD